MRPLALLLSGVLLLSGCLLAPKYERDPEKVPQEYRFQSSAGQPQPTLKSLADRAPGSHPGSPVGQL
jgi:hypothetical protein